jgi:hypothetical protein
MTPRRPPRAVRGARPAAPHCNDCAPRARPVGLCRGGEDDEDPSAGWVTPCGARRDGAQGRICAPPAAAKTSWPSPCGGRRRPPGRRRRSARRRRRLGALSGAAGASRVAPADALRRVRHAGPAQSRAAQRLPSRRRVPALQHRRDGAAHRRRPAALVICASGAPACGSSRCKTSCPRCPRVRSAARSPRARAAAPGAVVSGRGGPLGGSPKLDMFSP